MKQMKEKETMSERVSVNEAARILGMSPTSVRFQMKKKTLPIGRAVPPEKNGSSRWAFYIYRRMLNQVIGKEEDEGI